MTYKPNFYQKFISWFCTYNIETISSKVSGSLEVNLRFGKIVIDSVKANYSFGNLHLVYREALSSIVFDFSKHYKVLILGFGAGSIAHILKNEIGIQCSISGVELDDAIIGLSKKYYSKNLWRDTQIFNEDALLFLHSDTEHYDIVCVDLFIDTHIPSKFKTLEFLKLLESRLNKNAYLFMNTMQNNIELKDKWQNIFGSTPFISIQENEILFYQR